MIKLTPRDINLLGLDTSGLDLGTAAPELIIEQEQTKQEPQIIIYKRPATTNKGLF